MERKSQSVRLGIEEHALVAAEMQAGNVKFSEAVRRLLHRGSGAPEPTYLKAQVSCREELDTYVEQSELWRRQWADIGGLVRASLPPNADEATKKLVATAKANAAKLLEQSLELGAVARHLAKKMMGLGQEELAELRECKKYLSDIIARHRKYLAEGESSSMKPETLRAMERVLLVLKGLGI